MKTTGFLKEHKGTPTPWLMQIRFTLTSLIKGHVHLLIFRKSSSLPTVIKAYPFIKFGKKDPAYPFIRSLPAY